MAKAKELKKKGRRLKRTVRKTLGTICLITAILIASIPVDGVRQVAAEDTGHSKLSAADMEKYFKIPDLSKYKGRIYSTGDNKFRFAYVDQAGTDNGSTKFAVILDYNPSGSLEDGGTKGMLIIPDTVDAYLNYRTTEGTNEGNVAVGARGNFLFYRTETLVYPDNPDEGPTVSSNTPPEVVYTFQPCFYWEYQNWADEETLYYYPTSDFRPDGKTDPIEATTDSEVRIKGAMVAYIGNQYLETDKQTGEQKIVEADEEHSVFSGKGSITYLVVGSNLSGIGNFAFYNCTGLKSITLSNALNTIGNYAFAGCRNMIAANLNINSDITAIGAHAFENCEGLTSFTVPIGVTHIGDAAFMGCRSMTSIELCGAGQNVSLQEIGCDMFVDCRSLLSVTFPHGYTEDVDISNFKNCLSLGSITVHNTTMNIVEGMDSSFGYEDFKKQYNESPVVHGTFYFAGPTTASNPSELHKMARKKYFAFSYLNDDAAFTPQNMYELTVDADSGKQATYRVNNQNQLIETVLDPGIAEIDLPAYIGPYHIAEINANVFKDDCYLKKLTVPATVESIASEAFVGCHNLEHVVFEDPTNLTIGNGAFQTQKVGIHQANDSLVGEPTLTFTGPISPTSAPFVYAMDPANRINDPDQQKLTYITYYSGWPSNLTVQYNPETDKNELVDYPTLMDLSHNVSEDYSQRPYMTDDYAKAMQSVIDKKTNESGADLTEAEAAIWDAVMNIVLPEGVESVKAGLFKEKEVGLGDETHAYFKTEEGKNSYKTLSAYGLKEVAGDDDPDDGVDSGAFANWTTLASVTLYGGTESIGDYAFKGCKQLTSVTLPQTVTQMGLIPFTGCEKLSYVNFQGSEYFSCDNSIIYRLDTAGNKYALIEYLEGRPSSSITSGEVTGVKEIAEEAFANTRVSFVDLSSADVARIPERAFGDCERLIQVILPNSVRSVENGAFTGCPNMQRLTVPNLNTVFRQDAVDTSGPNRPNDLVFVCNDESMAHEYAVTWDFATDPNGVEVSYKVVFQDWDGTELKVEYVVQGHDATPPDTPHREGYDFVGWNKEYRGIKEDVVITAMYETEDPNAKKVTVTFYDDDQTTVLYTRSVTIGQTVELPPDPVKEGYVFMGWIGDVTSPITQPTNIYAKFEATDNRFLVRFLDYDGTVLFQQLVDPGKAADEPKTPSRTGYTFNGWVPADFTNITKDTDIFATYITGDGQGGNNPGSNTPGNNPGSNTPGNNPGGNDPGTDLPNEGKTKLYTLTVQNGSGSGSYVAGSQPVVIANNPANGQEFSHWTIDPSDTKIASTVLSATVITMPEKNVTVTAHYKAKSGSSTVSGNASSNGSGRPGTSGLLSNGTTVVIDKNGLSNTGVVSATVKGSTDNFTIKVTESSAASEAVLKALQAEYGDISNIKYFPMDISLYDSTGTKKITDTTGLSISITLPLPDSLITYAGNNQVAGVVNNRLDKLSPKFTTIDKVACVTFTAEHFSPYVIYVETDNLSKGVVTDNTPKTGDGIHPKWFLSIGLACVAVVLFMKKDKRSVQKVRVA